MTDDEFSLDDDYREDPAETSRGTRTFLTGIAVGALIGAGFALLYAPDRGSRTRRRLGRKMRQLKDRSGDSVREMKNQLRKELQRVRRA